MPRTLALSALIGILLTYSIPAARAADAVDSVEKALARPVLKKGRPLEEVQRFTEERVPHMPEVRSLADWEAHAKQMRADAFKHVIFRGEAAAWRDARCKVEWLGTRGGGPGYRVLALRYEAIPGLWIPALLYEPEHLAGKVPVVLNVNGHDRPLGKAADYKQTRCINLAKRGMLALNPEWLGMGQLNGKGYDHALINAIDLCGTSGIATHYLAMTRGLDILLAHEHADPARVAVTGLSGGGWQTIFVSAFDTRVTLTDPVAGYSSFRTRVREFSDLGDSEQTPNDLATVTDYSQMTAMMAPRATLLTFNAKDNCCFAAGHALPPLWEAAYPIFHLYGKPDNLRSHVNDIPGTHNYEVDNRQAFYRMVGDHFYAGDPGYDATEIPCTGELRTRAELDLPLPADNADFHTISLAMARPLPREPELPTERAAAEHWQRTRRDRLRDIVRWHDYQLSAKQVGSDTFSGITAKYWDLKVGESWTVPAVELSRGEEEPKGCAILVSEDGKKSLRAAAQSALDAGLRVLALDPFYRGESQIDQRSSLFALLVDTVGNRPLGLQASQLAATARWLKSAHPHETVTIRATGPVMSLAALVAAGVEDLAINRVELEASLGSLKEALEQSVTYSRTPEYFCFGLLVHFDIKQLAALSAPRQVVFHAPSNRARKELAGLKDWYKTLGGEGDPISE